MHSHSVLLCCFKLFPREFFRFCPDGRGGIRGHLEFAAGRPGATSQSPIEGSQVALQSKRSRWVGTWAFERRSDTGIGHDETQTSTFLKSELSCIRPLVLYKPGFSAMFCSREMFHTTFTLILYMGPSSSGIVYCIYTSQTWIDMVYESISFAGAGAGGFEM